MILVMVQSLLVLILLEEEHTTIATLVIKYLTIQAEVVSYQEHGVEHSQHVSVSICPVHVYIIHSYIHIFVVCIAY